MTDPTRRQFMGATAVFAATPSGSFKQVDTGDENPDREFQGVADLIGRQDQRPEPGSAFFQSDDQRKIYYAYRYTASDTGAVSKITQDDDAWAPINYLQHQPVFSSDDLPAPTNGTHTLVDNTAYHFYGFVTSPYGIELGNSTPLIGRHGSIDGFIHVGGNTAIVGTDAGHFARELYFHAPGGTMFDLSAGQSTEMLVESCSYSDAAGIGQIANLGTIDGYRVPSFKGCNFEHFASGLTFTGTPQKVFIKGSPFRSITESAVTIVNFDSNFEGDIVVLSDNYTKSVQSDTVVVYVDPAATVSEIFQYRDNTHDGTVTQANILTGSAGVDTVGYRISDSYPLANSKSYIDYTLDAETTTTISTQATSKTDETAYVRVAGPTSELGSARFTHTDNEVTYVGKRDRIAELTAVLSVGTGTSDIVAGAWFQNGSLVPGTATRIQMNQQGGGVSKALVSSGVDGQMELNDTLDVRVANLGSTTDVIVGELAAKIST